LSPALAYCETGLSFESSYRFTFSSPAGLLKVRPALKSGNLMQASKSTYWAINGPRHCNRQNDRFTASKSGSLGSVARH
jgi:hypothetical protein